MQLERAMVGAARGRPIDNEVSSSAACWQLGDIRDDERPGRIFRIRADHHREIIAQLDIECRVDETARGLHRLISDLAAVARCIGLSATAAKQAAHTPVTITLEQAAIERPVSKLAGAVRRGIDRIAMDPRDRYFVVCACYVGRELSVALPCDEILRVALPRPKCLAFQAAEIRRTRTGIELAPVHEVLSWLRVDGAVGE